MAGKKRERRANGDKDKNGKNRRRRNGTGTLAVIGGKWVARYYIYVNGCLKRKAKTINADLVCKARERAGLPTDGIAEPFSVEDARLVLGYLSEDGGKITRELMLKNAVRELQGVEAEREEAEKAAAEAERKRADEEADRRAVKIADAFALYEASKKRPDSGERTLSGYRSQYAAFATWTATHYPDRPKMRDFTPDMAEDFLEHLEQTRSRNTRNKYLVFLRTFWRVLRWNPDAQLTIDPWEGIKNLTQAPDEVVHKELTADELARIGQAITGDDLKSTLAFKVTPTDGRKAPYVADLRGELLALFAVGIYTGLRLGDCACLSWADIDTVRGIIDTMPRKTVRKYKRRVIIPIHPTLAAILASVPSAENRMGYVLPTLADIYENRQPSIITKRVQEILCASGITTTASGESGTKARTLAGFHSLRHTFASIMLNAGVSYALVEKMLGHAKESMTAHYFHENAAALAAAVSKLPTITAMLPNGSNVKTTLPEVKAISSHAVTSGNVPANRLTAFRHAWDALTPEERETARAYISSADTETIETTAAEVI